MSRKEQKSEDGSKAIAYGVEGRARPGQPYTFVQVWSVDQECDIGPYEEYGETNMLASEDNIDVDRVVQLGKEHGIIVDPIEVFKLFD